MPDTRTQRRFVVVEPSLLGYSGHHHEFAVGAAEAARRRGFAPLVLANRNAGPPLREATVPIVPWFPRHAYQPGAEYGAAPADRFSTLLNMARDRFALGAGDQLVFPTLGVEHFAGAFHAVREWPAEERPFLHLSFLLALDRFLRPMDRFVTEHGLGPSLAEMLAAWRATAGLWPHRSAFYAYEERTRAAIGRCDPESVHLLALPVRTELLRPDPGRDRLPRHVVFLGGAREEKGYGHLPGVLERLQEHLGRTVRFTLHSCLADDVTGEAWAPVHQRMMQYPPEQVRHIERRLTSVEYADLVNDADIVLLPYRAESYRHRTSAVLVEALAAGKPVIVPAGTWLAEQVDARTAIAVDSVERIAPAVLHMVEHYPDYGAAARELAATRRVTHSMEAFVANLLSVAERAGQVHGDDPSATP